MIIGVPLETFQYMNLAPQVAKCLTSIEQMQSEWVVFDEPNDHHFGRLPGEKEIRAWSVPRTTGLFLHTLVRTLKPLKILEIGTSFGYSTIWLASASPGSTVHTVEIYPPKISIAKKNFTDSELDNIVFHEMDALELASNWNSTIQFLFLDADGQNYQSYFECLNDCFSQGSVIVMDNALNHEEVNCSFVKHIQNLDNWDSWIVPIDNGLFFAEKRGVT